MSEKWSESKIMERLSGMHYAGNPLNSYYVQTHDKQLHNAIFSKRYFMSYSDAVESIGLDYSKIKRVSYKKPKQSWNKQKILENIQKLNKEGERLSLKHVKWNHTALYRAGCRYFCSWKNAILNSGIDYNKIKSKFKSKSQPRKWSRDEIVKKFTELLAKNEPVNLKYIFANYPKLYEATRIHFGSYREAIERLGLDYDDVLANKNKMEEYMKRLLDKLLPEHEKLDNVRLKCLNNSELDRYYPNLKLAFEYDGVQHYKFVKWFHKNMKRFNYYKQLHTRKEELCKKNDITLIRIRYDEKLSEQFLLNKLQKVKVLATLLTKNYRYC